MSIYTEYKTDETAENEGIEVKLYEAPNEDGSIPTFVVSRMGQGNKAYSKELEVRTRPYRRQIELGVMKNETAKRVMLEVFCNSVLKLWCNVPDENGQFIPFSPKAAIELLTKLPDLYSRLEEEAKLASNFRSAQLESEAGN